jgi:hypothetical protein
MGNIINYQQIIEKDSFKYNNINIVIKKLAQNIKIMNKDTYQINNKEKKVPMLLKALSPKKMIICFRNTVQ